MSFSAHLPVLLPQRDSDQLAPLPWPSAAASLGMFMPSDFARVSDSKFATMVAHSSMLLIILAIWPGADIAEMQHVAAEGLQHRARARKPALLAADIDGAGAVVGGFLAEHHRRIEHADILCRGKRGEAPAGFRRDRARDADHRAGRERIEQA